MRDILNNAFAPTHLEIEDESGRHAGHAGRNNLPNGETHYHITMSANTLKGQSRVARARAVHEALAEEFKTGLHALSLTLSVPD